MMLLLLLTPLLGALILPFIRKKNSLTLAFFAITSIELLLTLYFFSTQQIFLNTFVNQPWIIDFGIRLKFGVDGLSALLILLTNAIVWIIGLSAKQSQDPKPAFFSCLLFSQASLIGFFSTQDLFLFYIFWELSVLPFLIINTIWVSAEHKKKALTFTLYSLASSLLLLLVVAFIYSTRFSYSHLVYPDYIQVTLFGLTCLAFAIKTPLFPLNKWQPDVYAENKPEASLFMASLLSKMGLYGMIRVTLSLFPLGFVFGSHIIFIAATISVLAGAFFALVQPRFKYLLAFSSVSHLSLIVLGLFSASFQGVQGSIFQCVSHSICVAGLFYCGNLIQQHFGTDHFDKLGGIRNKSSLLTVAFFVITLGSIGFPLTSGFIGELLILSGVFFHNPVVALIAGTSLIFGAWYMLKAFSQIFLGPEQTHHQPLQLELNQKIILSLFIVLVIGLGLFPNTILTMTEPVVNKLLFFGALK